MPNYRALARRYAIQAGIDPDVFLRQINQESGFNPHAHSPAGAIGIAQIMPRTASGWGVNPNDPQASLRAAAQHMAQYARQYGGIRNALVAYNAGPGRVGHSLPAETRNYIKTILGGHDGGAMPSGGAGGGIPQVSSQAPQGQNIFSTIASLNAPFVGNDPLKQSIQHGWDMLAQLRGQSNSPSVPSMTGGGGGGGGGENLPSGVVKFEGKPVAAWILPELKYARAHGWKGTITSGYRSRADQQRIWDSGQRPAARPGTSNHEGDVFPRGAVDVTDPQTLAEILRKRHSRLVWAGAKDQVHFSHPHGGSY